MNKLFRLCFKHINDISFWIDVLYNPVSLKFKLLKLYRLPVEQRINIINYIFCFKKTVEYCPDTEIIFLLSNFCKLFNPTYKEILQIYLYCNIFNLKQNFIESINDQELAAKIASQFLIYDLKKDD